MLLDNGSTDRTLTILQALRTEDYRSTCCGPVP